MLYGWVGKDRSGIAPCLRWWLIWFIHLWAQGLQKGDEHLAYR